MHDFTGTSHMSVVEVDLVTKTYHMVLRSPMGPREGTLTLDERCGEVVGTLCILSHALPVRGRRGTDGRLYLTHPIITAVSEYPCQSVLQDRGDTLCGELWMDQSGALWGRSKYQTKTVMTWSGKQLEGMEATRN